MADIKLNAVGKKCPMPVLMTKKELRKMKSGDKLHLIVDDKGALKDVPALIKKTGDTILDTTEEDKLLTFTIQKV